MTPASISDIKKELQTLEPKQLAELCMFLAKYKKDNKEYLCYLLFDAHDKESAVKSIKEEIDIQFTQINHINLHVVKKSLRKILRITNKYIKYIGSKQYEAELLIHFCEKIKQSRIPIQKSVVLQNLYNAQLKKINTAISSLHEDLQYDYHNELEALA
jgi:hypothetical protein